MPYSSTDPPFEGPDVLLLEFRDSLQEITGPAHPIYISIRQDYGSIADILYATMRSALMRETLNSVPGPDELAGRPEPVVLVDSSPASLAVKADRTFQLNTSGILRRLSDYPNTPELTKAVYLTIYVTLEKVMKADHDYTSKDIVARDSHHELFNQELERWMRFFDPSKANLHTFLKSRTRRKAIKRPGQRNVGLRSDMPLEIDLPESARFEDRAVASIDLHRLPELQDPIYKYKYVDDLPSDQIAEKLGLPSAGAARAKSSRWHEKIRKKLNPLD